MNATYKQYSTKKKKLTYKNPSMLILYLTQLKLSPCLSTYTMKVYTSHRGKGSTQPLLWIYKSKILALKMFKNTGYSQANIEHDLVQYISSTKRI